MSAGRVISVVSESHIRGTLATATVNFTIDNFSYRKHVTEALCSLPAVNEKSLPELEDGQWFLKVTPFNLFSQGFSKEKSGHVKVQVCFRSNAKKSVPAKFSISIVSPQGKLLFKCSPEDQTKTFGPEPISSWGYPDFISHEKLFDLKSGLLNNDALILQAKINYLVSPGTTECSRPMIQKPLSPIRTNAVDILLNDISELFRSKAGSDYVLVSGDRTEHAVHRSILIARSRVFRSLLIENGKKQPKGRCDIPDIDWVTLDVLLEFLYTAATVRITSVAENLLIAADRFEIADLKKVCTEYLIEILNKDNMQRFLALAERTSAVNLRNAAIDLLSEETLAQFTRAVTPEEADRYSGKVIQQLENLIAGRTSGTRRKYASTSISPTSITTDGSTPL